MAKELPSYASKLISVRPLTDDYLEILLEIPAGFTWEAGQYMRLGLPTKEVTDQKKSAPCPLRAYRRTVTSS